jgi:hypothetical protein
MKHSTGKPTVAEAQRIDLMLRLGCCACELVGMRLLVRPECHHILRGHRLGHWYTIPLCAGHHRGDWSISQCAVLSQRQRVAISNGRKRFTSVYPDERTLWESVQDKLKLPKDWPASKVLARKTA